jgi:hypothetical protein
MSFRVSYNYRPIYISGPPPTLLPRGPKRPGSPDEADLWVAEGPNEIQIYGGTAYERDTPVNFTESSTFVTPTVEIVSLTFRLSR